jgi:hypothetical protein
MEVNMKKFGLVAVFAVVAVAMTFSASLSVTGNVTQVLTVSLGTVGTTTGSVAIAIDNTGTAVESANAANLILVSSQRNWTISFASANLGYLKNANSTTDILYQVKVDTSSLPSAVTGNSLSAYTQLTALATKTITPTSGNGKTPVAGSTFPISFNIPAYTAFLETVNTEGTTTAYTDTVTITVAAN